MHLMHSWLLRALCLCSLVKNQKWPWLQATSTWKSVLFTVWINQSWIGVGCRENIRLKLYPKPHSSEAVLPQQLIPIGNADSHLSCCSQSFLPLWPCTPTTAIPKRVYELCASYKLFLSHPSEKFNNCQSHEQTETVSRLYSTTMRCLQLQLSVTQKEEEAGASSCFLQLLQRLRGLPSQTKHSSAHPSDLLAPDECWELNSIKHRLILCRRSE